MTHRREFLRKWASLVAGSIVSSQLGAQPDSFNLFKGNGPALKTIGVNLFSLPKMLEKDFAAGMQMLAKIGYKEIEFYGPYSFSAREDKERWDAVTPSLGFSGSGFYGLNIQQAKKILDDNGLSTPSMHTGLFTLHKAMDQMAEAAHVLGARYIVLPSAATQANLDGYKTQADEFNAIGMEAEKRGVRFAYHNHGNGLKEIEGIIPMDLIIARTDPKYVFFQMDIFWTTAGGIDVVKYLDKHAGRYRLMHVKDMTKAVRFSGDGGDSNQWVELFPYLTNAGTGVLDLKTILSHAESSGVEHFIVERDIAPNPKEDLQKSFSFLSN